MAKSVTRRFRLKGSKKPCALVVVRFECDGVTEEQRPATAWFVKFLQLMTGILLTMTCRVTRLLLKLCNLLLAYHTEILMFIPNVIDKIIFAESLDDNETNASAYPTHHYEQITMTNDHDAIEDKKAEQDLSTTDVRENDDWVCSKCKMSERIDVRENSDVCKSHSEASLGDYYERTETTVVTTTTTEWEAVGIDNEAYSSDETIATSDDFENDWYEYYSGNRKVWFPPIAYKFKGSIWSDATTADGDGETTVDDATTAGGGEVCREGADCDADEGVGADKADNMSGSSVQQGTYSLTSSVPEYKSKTSDSDFGSDSVSIQAISETESVPWRQKGSTLILQIPDHIMARLYQRRSPPTTPEVDYSDSEDEKTSAPLLPERTSYVVKPSAAHDEPILNASRNEERFVLFPVKYPDIYDMYKRQVAQFWTMEEIDLSKDLADWNDRLSCHERDFFKCILAFFAPSDGIVGENIVTRFYDTVVYTEARYFYAFQAAMENIHAEVYSQLIKTLIPNEQEQQAIFSSFMSTPGIMEKTRWAKQWLERDNLSFVERLVAFAVVEGLLFSGSFASIFWLKKRGLMQGLTFSNELISRDEGLHCDFACLLYTKHIVHKLPNHVVYNIVREAVHAESVFFSHALQNGPVGELSQHNMMQYVRFCADRLLLALEVPPLYSATNPFDFMHMISLDGRTNFFERRVGEYRQSRVLTQRDGTTDNDNHFTLDYRF